MSLYGKKWLIDGLPAGIIMRSNPANGRYTVVFEREFASLEQIEAGNWDKPTVEYIGPHGSEDGLPEGHGFEVEDIRYRSSTKSFDVILKTASQYLGDVTGYQDQIDQLEAASAERTIRFLLRHPRSRSRRPPFRKRRLPLRSRPLLSRIRRPPLRNWRAPAAERLSHSSWRLPIRKE